MGKAPGAGQIRPCLEKVMPELGREAARGREASGRRLWEESGGEGSTEQLAQGRARVGLPMALKMALSSVNQ